MPKKGISVMVVEDESIVAKDIERSLEFLGYDVPATFAEGERAVVWAEKFRPDLVLMDIHLKGKMDGIEAAGILRSRFGMPIIYLTAHADTRTLERAKETQPLAYLVKPFEEQELNSTIEIALYRFRFEQKMKENHNRLEEQLIEAYKHLGTLNRRTSFLLDLEKEKPYLQKKKQEFTRYILQSAMNLSRAKLGMIFKYKGGHNFELVSQVGLMLRQAGQIRRISINSEKFFASLRGKKQIRGVSGEQNLGCLNFEKKSEYFLLLPLVKEKDLKGFIFFGFSKERNLTDQELEFYDIFAAHAVKALEKADIIN